LGSAELGRKFLTVGVAAPDPGDVVLPVDVAVEADDEAALAARPVEVEEISVAHVAHLPNALDDPFPRNHLVWKETIVRCIFNLLKIFSGFTVVGIVFKTLKLRL
jgi:hypothetical protein